MLAGTKGGLFGGGVASTFLGVEGLAFLCGTAGVDAAFLGTSSAAPVFAMVWFIACGSLSGDGDMDPLGGGGFTSVVGGGTLASVGWRGPALAGGCLGGGILAASLAFAASLALAATVVLEMTTTSAPVLGARDEANPATLAVA